MLVCNMHNAAGDVFHEERPKTAIFLTADAIERRDPKNAFTIYENKTRKRQHDIFAREPFLNNRLSNWLTMDRAGRKTSLHILIANFKIR